LVVGVEIRAESGEEAVAAAGQLRADRPASSRCLPRGGSECFGGFQDFGGGGGGGLVLEDRGGHFEGVGEPPPTPGITEEFEQLGQHGASPRVVSGQDVRLGGSGQGHVQHAWSGQVAGGSDGLVG
jgi:hypothetical protein